MSGTKIRQQFISEFRGLQKNAGERAALIILSYLLQIGAAICGGAIILNSELSVAGAVALALLVLFIGTRLRGLNNIVHECFHFSFCESRDANVFFGRICASLLLNCFRDYREEHLSHHAHLGDYDNDLDFQRLRKLRLEEPLTVPTMLRHVLTALSGKHLRYYVNINLRAGDGRGFRALKVGIIAAAVVFLLVAPIKAAILVWLPFLWVYPAINYLTDCIDHGGLMDGGDDLEASRNLPVPAHLRVLLFPRNDCYHLVHHLFPQVPVDHLAACHSRLLSHPDYRARAEAPVLELSVASRLAASVAQQHRRLVPAGRSNPLANRVTSAAGVGD